MFNEIPELDEKGLRELGLITGALFAGLFGVLLPWAFTWSWPVWPWVILTLLALMAFIKPITLRPVYHIWMRFGLIIGSIMSRIILGLVFFVVVTPLGLLMRATGKDPMNRKLEHSRESYREPIEDNKSNSFDKPF